METYTAESGYRNACSDILFSGTRKSDRTGTGTISFSGVQLVFKDVGVRFPLLTSKKMNIDIIAKELEWMISGCTDAKVLHDRGVKIWDANGTREFLDKCGLKHRAENDLGPIYGFQWRHWGAKYVDCKTDYTGQGIDQLQETLNLLSTCPESRRMVVSAWNVADLKEMALPPCHYSFQLIADEEGVDCVVSQRSGDMGLGIPFNIASYALLLILMCKHANKKPRDLVINIGDAHIYQDHVEMMEEQVLRTYHKPPRIVIKQKEGEPFNMFAFKAEDVELVGYKHEPALKMKMSV